MFTWNIYIERRAVRYGRIWPFEWIEIKRYVNILREYSIMFHLFDTRFDIIFSATWDA